MASYFRVVLSLVLSCSGVVFPGLTQDVRAAGAGLSTGWSQQDLPALAPVAMDDPRVSHAFAALGPMIQVGPLVWSAPAHRRMNQSAADGFCRGLGLGARLPSEEEFQVLPSVLVSGEDRRYTPEALDSEIRGNSFWSAPTWSSFFTGKGMYWRGSDGQLYDGHHFAIMKVLCVQPVSH
jgi:hypothetical protein